MTGWGDRSPGRRWRCWTTLRWGAVALFFAAPAAAQVLHFLGAFIDRPGDLLSGLGGAEAVAVSPDGRHVFVAGRDDDAVAMFVREGADGRIRFLRAVENGIDGVFGLDGVAAVAASPDGRHLYVAAGTDDAVTVFARDATHDALVFIEAQQQAVGGVFGLDGASGLAVSPDGRHLYATGAVSSALAVFARDATRDGLAFVGAVEDGAAGVDGLAGAAAVAVSPDDRSVYVAGASDSALAVFARDATTDELTFLEAHFDGVAGVAGLAGAEAVAVSPDGRRVFVASAEDDALAVFGREASGRLRQTQVVQLGSREKMAAPSALASSPDGRYLVVAGRASSDLVVLRRGDGGRQLVVVERHAEDEDGATGLSAASGLATTPDGRHLLVTGAGSNSLAVFDFLLFADGFESGDLAGWSEAP